MPQPIPQPVLGPDARIGIANRGEAALRCIRAVHEFNAIEGTAMAAVALYTQVEEDALFVQEADSAVLLDRTDFATHYLDRQLIVDTLLSAACTAVWVGWGFVSEAAQFAEMVEAAGIVFLGPDSGAMARLGDKIEAKRLAAAADVPILPWSEGPVPDVQAAEAFAEQIGYPVIVKAANAGGGRGIRFVQNRTELSTQYTSALEETRRITGDDILFIERLVTTGRHLEVQCLADRHGEVRTFGVRDCSVQRRNQKIIEETPPPNLSVKQRQHIEQAAARLIREARYESAGTVEFLFDVDREEFYFMEVNTRLQVEHPITEELYGVDLVHGQLRVARGESISGMNAVPRGHVIEARLNAEDPDDGFVPAPGRVSLFVPPAGPGVRCDSGIHEGGTVPREFDSMVAKIIARGANRREATGRLERALRELRIQIDGGTTNRAFVLRLLASNEFRAGGVSTSFVERFLADTTARASDGAAAASWTDAVAACAVHHYRAAAAARDINVRGQLAAGGSPRAVSPATGEETSFAANGLRYELIVREVARNRYHISAQTVQGAEVIAVRYERRGPSALLTRADRRVHVQIVERGDLLQCEIDGVPHRVHVESGGAIRASSPAVVLAIHARAGGAVRKGDLLLSLEAMKMEIPVVAAGTGVVREIRVKVGEQVAAAQELVRIDAADTEGGSESALQDRPAETFADEKDTTPGERWGRAAEEYAALFLGYDVAADDLESPVGIFDRLVAAADERPDDVMTARLTAALTESVAVFAAVERLFSDRIPPADGARGTAHIEQLAHWARREVDRDKGMGDMFLADLRKALSFYTAGSEPGVEAVSLIVRMYQSRALAAAKREVLRRALLTLERRLIPEDRLVPLSDALDSVAELSGSESRSLADAAIHARYALVDRRLLLSLTERKRANVARLFVLLERYATAQSGLARSIQEKLYRYATDAGNHVLPELAAVVLFGDSAFVRRHGMEVLTRRLVRDRAVVELDIDTPLPDRGGSSATTSHVQTSDGGMTTVIAATGEEVLFSAVETELPGRPEEIVALLYDQNATERSAADSVKALAERLCKRVSQGAGNAPPRVAIGILTPGGAQVFRTVEGFPPGLRTAPLGMNPLQYRELRIERLARFDLRQVYESENCWVLSLTARENQRDERLFAFVDVPSARAEVGPSGRVQRMVALEQVFMEAVYAMRAEQSHRSRRLYWNRMVIRIHAPLQFSIDQVRDYGRRLSGRTADIGLERLVILTRRPGTTDGQIEETELVFENISGSRFALRGRVPSDEPLAPMDSYVARVVRSRQRGAIYPYEIIKMITRSGIPMDDGFPRGEFEEFDLDDNDPDRAISVRGRDYGKNSSNVVFGIVTNYLPTHDRGLKRVIVLSDSTGDLGSLAEPESRRVIAALDLAEQRGHIVEWIPVSAGARIDMESGTENLDWTAAALRRIIAFTQSGGEINVIVANVNVGAQSYWNAEATMLMHTRGLLIMTQDASILLTGKKALDFSGSVSGENNVAIGGATRIMAPNGQAQITVRDLNEAYAILFRHYALTAPVGSGAPRVQTADSSARDVSTYPYKDPLGQGFRTVGDIFSAEMNAERKKPFDMRQVMRALIDTDADLLERWHAMRDAETAIVWESRIGGHPVGVIGIESRPLTRFGEVPFDGPESWTGGTLFPQSSKKVARALNAFSGRIPVVVLANLSGFDGSPESLRKLQLEYGAEIGRAVVNFEGPIIFVVTARYHGGAYVVFSKALNPNLHAVAIDGAFASVIGGAPAAAVVFPGLVRKEVISDPRVAHARGQVEAGELTKQEYEALQEDVRAEKQAELAAHFDSIHSIERARRVGSIDAVIPARELRSYVIKRLHE